MMIAPLAAALAAVRGTPYPTRVAAAGAASLLVALYVRAAVAVPSRPPSARLVAALPALLLYAVIPLSFDPVPNAATGASEVITAGVSAFALLWLAAFKTIGAAVGRGPLIDGAAWTPLQFAFAMLLPVTVHQGEDATPHTTGRRASLRSAAKGGASMRRVPSRSRVGEAAPPPWAPARVRAFAGKAALLLFTCAGLTGHAPWQGGGFAPGFPTAVAYVFALYALLGVLMDGPFAAAAAAVGLTLSPHFHAPFLSSSVGDLWSRRWNLVAGHTLRFLVYDPIVDGRLLVDRARAPPRSPPRPSRARRLAAVAASFAVSGAVHELILFIIQPGLSPYAGYWFLYFASQAAFLAAESVLIRAWTRAGLRPLPAAVSVPAVVGGGLVWAHLFFLPPAVKTGLGDRVLHSLKSAVGAR